MEFSTILYGNTYDVLSSSSSLDVLSSSSPLDVLSSSSPLETTASTNTSATNCSMEAWIYPELEELSRSKAYLYLPVIIFLFILMILGTIGNSLVLYIYCFRSKKRSSNYFIISMAVFDLITSSVVMPIDIYDLFEHYTFYYVAACKIFRTLENATTYASAIILMQVAFDRYFKICKPLRFGHKSRTKCMSISATIIGVILSIPASILFGIRREHINGELCGFDCSVDEKYEGSKFQMIYFVVLGFVMLLTFGLLSTLYFMIWLAIKRRKGLVIGDNPRNSQIGNKINGLRKMSSVSDDDSSSSVQNPKQFRRTFSNTSTKSKLSTISERLSNIRCSRTTKIFVAVTVAFVASFLPSIAVNICRSVMKNIDTDSSKFVQVILKLFSRCHYLNNAINPLIYSFLNKHFRLELTRLSTSIGFCCKHRLRRSWSISSGSSKKSKSSRSNSYKSERTHEYEMENLKVST